MPNQYLPPVITIPSSLQITAISQSFPMVITVEIANPSTEVNTYQAGQLLHLTIPRPFGMWQAANKTVEVLSVSGFDISVKMDSTNFDAFVIPSSTGEAPPTVSPTGSRNLQFNNNTRQVPFQSLNNRGN